MANEFIALLESPMVIIKLLLVKLNVVIAKSYEIIVEDIIFSKIVELHLYISDP